MQAEVLDEDSNVMEELSEGENFGDKSLIYNTSMQSSVLAVTHVDVFSINQKDFESVLHDHPNSRDSIAELAEKQYGQTMVIIQDWTHILWSLFNIELLYHDMIIILVHDIYE